MNLTIGCDPELFLFDKTKQRIVPAIGLVEGTKQNPKQLVRGTVQLDGTVVEIGTNPAANITSFKDNLRSVLSEVQEMVGDNYELRCGSIAAYHPDDWQFSDTYLDTGCEAQFVFEGDTLTRVASNPYDITAVPTGGHIHVGFGCDLEITDPVLLRSVKMFVDALGMPEIPELDGDRLSLMGMTDKQVVRVKPYGVELRNPSAYWLASPDLLWGMYKLIDWTTTELKGEADPVAIKNFIKERIRTHKRNLVAKIAAQPAKYQRTLPIDI